MFGKTTMTKDQAIAMAKAINNWFNFDYCGYHRTTNYAAKEIVTAEDCMAMHPIFSKDKKPYPVYAIQWGDVTILVCISSDGTIRCQHTCW